MVENFDSLIKQINNAEKRARNILWGTILAILIIIMSAVIYIIAREKNIKNSFELRIVEINKLIDSINYNIAVYDSLGVLLVNSTDLSFSNTISTKIDNLIENQINPRLKALEKIGIESIEQEKLNTKLVSNYRGLIAINKKRIAMEQKINESQVGPIENTNVVELQNQISVLSTQLNVIRKKESDQNYLIRKIAVDLRTNIELLQELKKHKFRTNDKELDRLEERLRNSIDMLEEVSY